MGSTCSTWKNDVCLQNFVSDRIRKAILEVRINGETSLNIFWTGGVSCNIRWVPCHHGRARPRVADGREGLQIWKVAANVLCREVVTLQLGGWA
jgi:hypothetical protein